MGHYTTVQGEIEMSEEFYLSLKNNDDDKISYFLTYTDYDIKNNRAVWDGSELKGIYSHDYFRTVFDAIIENPNVINEAQGRFCATSSGNADGHRTVIQFRFQIK